MTRQLALTVSSSPPCPRGHSRLRRLRRCNPRTNNSGPKPATAPSVTTTPTGPSPPPTPIPLPPRRRRRISTPTPEEVMQEKLNGPRPGDEVFDLCRIRLETYSRSIVLLRRLDERCLRPMVPGWLSNLVQWPPSRFTRKPVALYSVDPAGQSLQKIVAVPDFYEAIDRYSVADGGG